MRNRLNITKVPPKEDARLKMCHENAPTHNYTSGTLKYGGETTTEAKVSHILKILLRSNFITNSFLFLVENKNNVHLST